MPGLTDTEPVIPLPVMTCDVAVMLERVQFKMTKATVEPISATLGEAEKVMEGVGPLPPPKEGSSCPLAPRTGIAPALAAPTDLVIAGARVCW